MQALEEKISPIRILIAEDSPTQRQIIKSVLKREGYDVILASDGIEAYTQALQKRPDLIVLDIEMPKMNGYQVCRLLKDDKRTFHMPVVILTSRDQETDKFWGLKTGADRYVTKDFKLTGLSSAIQEILEHRGISSGVAPVYSAGADSNHEDVDVLTRVNELLDRKLYEATIINEISKLNTLNEDCSVTVSSVLKVIAKVTDCHVCSIFLIEEEELVIHIQSAVDEDFFEESRLFAFEATSPLLPAGTSLSQIKEIRGSSPTLADDHDRDAGIVRSKMSIPLKARGQFIAMLTLTSPRKDAFSEEIIRVLELVEYPASVVIDNAHMHEETKRLAITDGLTRLFNHRHFYELLEQEFQRAGRYKTNLSMIMIDIDYFKHVNDTYGHQTGDEILKGLASVISHEVREVDVLARYGGEEFAVMLPQTKLEKARDVAERIRSGVEKTEFQTLEGVIKITVSLGVSGFPGDKINSQTDLVQQADSAMYEAKRLGKNCVIAGVEP